MRLISALIFISSLNEAKAEDAAQMAAQSAQCNRVQVEANADVGRKLVLECKSPNKCEACCHAAVAAYLQALENQKAALKADEAAQRTSVGFSADQAAIARSQAAAEELKKILDQAGLKIDPYYARYTANAQDNARIREVTEQVNKSYIDNFKQCSRKPPRAFANNTTTQTTTGGFRSNNAEAVSGQQSPPELTAEQRQQLTAQRVREIRSSVQVNFESLSRNFVDDRIGIRQANIFRMMSNQYRAQVQRGNLR